MESKYHIYGLSDPLTGVVRYVGKTERPHKRFMQHLHDGKNGTDAKSIWVRELYKQGRAPDFVILEVIDDREQAKLSEREWILKLRPDGNLTNRVVPSNGRIDRSPHRSCVVRSLNMQISDHAYRCAKSAAAARGMFLKRWIEELILNATKPQ